MDSEQHQEHLAEEGRSVEQHSFWAEPHPDFRLRLIHVMFVGVLPEDVAASLLNVADGGPSDDSLYRDYVFGQSLRPNYSKWIGLAVFLLLAVVPLPWIFLKTCVTGQREKQAIE